MGERIKGRTSWCKEEC